MKIDLEDLLAAVPTLRSPGTRIGLPDDPTPVTIPDPARFAAVLDDALRAFRDLRGGAAYLVSAELNSHHRTVGVRFVLSTGGEVASGQVEPSLEPSFRALQAVAAECGGSFGYWGGNNFLDVSLPFRGPIREDFPAVDHLPWDGRYRELLARSAWGTLRDRVFRFAGLAVSFAARGVKSGAARVLIPSVGLCVHPWLFADRGLTVVATDVAPTALAALSEPAGWPRLYSRAAFERWDVAQSALYASQGNPDRFASMPTLEDPGVRRTLQRRITFATADWTELPLKRGSVDAIFATNALPRDSAAEQLGVLREWGRVVRPGGLVLIAQHNFFGSGVESILSGLGWVEADILGGGAAPGATAYQIRYSSG